MNGYAAGAISNEQADLDALREIHQERVDAIAKLHGPVPIIDRASYVMHIGPLAAADGRDSPAITQLLKSPGKFPPFGEAMSQWYELNSDGLISGSNRDGKTTDQRAYAHVWRSGLVEAFLAINVISPERHLTLPVQQSELIRTVHGYLMGLAACGISAPITVFLTMIKSKGVRVIQDMPGGRLVVDVPCGFISKDPMPLGDFLFDHYPNNWHETAKILRPMLDHLAHAAGMATSPYFNEKGEYEINLVDVRG